MKHTTHFSFEIFQNDPRWRCVSKEALRRAVERSTTMFGLQPYELLIILVIVIVLFGATRLRGIGGALGQSIRDFKTAVREEDAPEAKVEKTDRPA
jgi:sec-independent protein translocase protein TatA